MQINLIVCFDSKFGIAKDGIIPWNYKEDLKLFRSITTNTSSKLKNVLIMGRLTAETLNKPLNDRINYVITNNKEKQERLENKGFKCFSCIETAIKSCLPNEIEKIFLIGGVEIYNWGLKNYNKINKIFTSILKKDYNCDKFFNKNLLIDYFNYDPKEDTDLNDFIFRTWFQKKQKNLEELAYLNLLIEIRDNGHKRQTRNAITYSGFGKTLTFDLSKCFPLLTTKKMFLRGIFEELKFFLLGQTNNKILKDKGVHIWDGNTNKEFIEKCGLPYEEDDMGPMYGYQWRHFNAEYNNSNTDYTNKGYDQLEDVIKLIKSDPFSRRILMTSYNPAQSKLGVLYPCHGISIQFYVDELNNNYYLNCLMNQRSGDAFLGIPFNISSYALLVYIICNHINCTDGIVYKKINPGKLMMVFCDIHIYEQHLEAVNKQIERNPYLFPQLNINYEIKNFSNKDEQGSIKNLEFTDLEIINYNSYDSIKVPMIA